MKKFKKIIALLIAMVMVLGMSMSVFADGATATDPASATPTTYAITVDTSDDAVNNLCNNS